MKVERNLPHNLLCPFLYLSNSRHQHYHTHMQA